MSATALSHLPLAVLTRLYVAGRIDRDTYRAIVAQRATRWAR